MNLVDITGFDQKPYPEWHRTDGYAVAARRSHNRRFGRSASYYINDEYLSKEEFKDWHEYQRHHWVRSKALSRLASS